MTVNFRLLITVGSMILTVVSFVYDMVLFNKYVGRGKYYYANITDETYLVVKEDKSIRDCSKTETIFTYGEINWLVVRNKRHYLFLTCFWLAILLPVVSSLLGAVLECKYNKPGYKWYVKVFRFLRSFAYKNAISIPMTAIFAFDYKKPCLTLRKTTSMVFSNSFTYTIIAIEVPLITLIFIHVSYEFYNVVTKKKPYGSVKSSDNEQPNPTPNYRIVLRRIFYVILWLVTILLLLLSLQIALKLFILIELPQLALVGLNTLLSVVLLLLPY